MARAVVLAGGGARGAYHIGVWQALRELGVDFGIVTGASIGAMNAALMAQGDFARARELWLGLTDERLLAARSGRGHLRRLEGGKVVEFIGDMARYGGTDTGLLEKTLRAAIDEEAVRRSPVAFGLSATRLHGLRPVQLTADDIPRGLLADYLAASSTYTPVFRAKEIDGARYMDGGYSDNMPVNLALRMGATEVVAVDLGSSGIVHRHRGDVPLTYISSAWYLGPALHFSPAGARRNMALGRLDALRAFGRAEGAAYAFQPGEAARNRAELSAALREAAKRCGPEIRGCLRRCGKNPGNRRRARVLGRAQPGKAAPEQVIAAAAERAGMEMHLSPERLYSFREFNGLLRKKLAEGGGGKVGDELRESCRILHGLYLTGDASGQGRKRLAERPELTAAAFYLLALAMN